ncbi:MAG: hypothetical protein LC126_05410 [Bryobacterales bacterium]|nr:hypothetical protein [Bryobacterales bacterium]
MNSCLQQIVACAAVWLCGFVMTPQVVGQNAAGRPLSIVVVEGQGAINNIRDRVGRDLVVRVETASQQPVSGASVVFTLPSQGASGAFVNGEKTLMATTDAQGQAAARAWKPNNIAGRMEVRVTASHQGQKASAVITVFNMAVQNAAAKSRTKLVLILLAAGGAGAAGAILGARGSSSSPTPPLAPATISISPGAGSVGPPR